MVQRRFRDCKIRRRFPHGIKALIHQTTVLEKGLSHHSRHLAASVLPDRTTGPGSDIGVPSQSLAPRDLRRTHLAEHQAGILLQPPDLLGVRTQILGDPTMDMLMVDLRGLPSARVGDSVVLWGEGLPVEEIAGHAGTIPYELLCRMRMRAPVVELAR